MASITQIRRTKRILMYVALGLLGLFFSVLILVDRFVEPLLRDRLHTLIIEGSDSLYTYKLGELNANFWGGNVEVNNLQVKIDSARYELLKSRNRLPALTMELNLDEGSIKGLSIYSLLFQKKIILQEIRSKKANLRLSRHLQVLGSVETDQPLWKSLQPDIEGIAVKRVRLEGVKLLYRNADTSASVKLQFDECNGLFEDIRIDSASSFDTTRVGFTKHISLRFHDLKFRTADSSYKMKAEWITYSSKDHLLEVDSFKLQPTLEKEDFYAANPVQKTLYYIEFAKVRFAGMRLDRFINNDIIAADSLLFDVPDVQIYLDRSQTPEFRSKVGNYPHQKLLKASNIINVKNIICRNGSVTYTEKNPKNGKEGIVAFSDFNLEATNVTNDKKIIAANPVCNMKVGGKLLKNTPVNIDFKFYLDSTQGAYDATGHIGKMTTAQVQPLAAAMANVQLNGLNIQKLDFGIHGRDFEAQGFLRMKYTDLALTLQKTDEETGELKTKKFLTKVLNKFALHSDNPGPDGVERVSNEARALRLSTQSFFGLLWKAIFDGMQDIMMKSGRVG